MHIGFTGSRHGMTDIQKKEFRTSFLRMQQMFDWIQFHHGDCIGADEEAHYIVSQLFIDYKGGAIHIHPPTIDKNRAYCKSEHKKIEVIMHPPLTYNQRNIDIVKASEILIAAPDAMRFKSQKGGTWNTIRYARDFNTDTLILLPSGDIDEEDQID